MTGGGDARPRSGIGLTEETEEGLRPLVGDRQRPDAQLLLNLQRLEAG